MKKTILLVASVLMLVSCGEVTVKPKPVAQNNHPEKPIATDNKKISNEKQNEQKQEEPKTPTISDYLDKFPLVKPEIKTLKAELIWQRHQGVIDFCYIDGKTVLTTNDSVYKGNCEKVRVLDEIGCDNLCYCASPPSFGEGFYVIHRDYISFNDKYISIVDKKNVTVYDILTGKTVFIYDNNPIPENTYIWFESAAIDGSFLYIADVEKIVCFDLTTKKQIISIRCKDISKKDEYKLESFFETSFIGNINGEMFIVIQSKVFIISKDGKLSAINGSINNNQHDVLVDQIIVTGINDKYINLNLLRYSRDQSTIAIIDLTKKIVFSPESDPDAYLKYLSDKYAYAQPKSDDFSTLLKLILVDNREKHFIGDDLYFFDQERFLCCFDLAKLKPKWKIEYKDHADFLYGLRHDQLAIRTAGQYYFYEPSSSNTFWYIDISNVKVAKEEEYERNDLKTDHLITKLENIRYFGTAWFDIPNGLVYSFGDHMQGAHCLTVKNKPKLTIIPNFSQVYWSNGVADYSKLSSMDIFVTWRGAEQAKGVLEYNSPENSKHRSEFELKPNVQTRVQIWFDQKGQKLTVNGVAHNIYNYQTWGAD
jgi:hypothetical protein